jgi:hypothetical protein
VIAVKQGGEMRALSRVQQNGRGVSEIAVYPMERFLEADGGQYINCGFTTGLDARFECLAYINPHAGEVYQYVYGDNSQSASAVSIYHTDGVEESNARFGSKAALIVVPQGVLLNIAQDASGVSVNGQFWAYASQGAFETYGNLTLFTASRSSSLQRDYRLRGKIAYFKVWKSGSLAMSLSPAGTGEHGASEPCMWDSVSGLCFYNQGTGSFAVSESRAKRAVWRAPSA